MPPFSFAIPSFVPDTTLEAAFPTEIDGQPAAMQSIGVDHAAVSFASATVMVGEESLSLQALRTPGGSAAYALDALVALDPPEVAPTTTTETIGGNQATRGHSRGLTTSHAAGSPLVSPAGFIS